MAALCALLERKWSFILAVVLLTESAREIFESTDIRYAPLSLKWVYNLNVCKVKISALVPGGLLIKAALVSARCLFLAFTAKVAIGR